LKNVKRRVYRLPPSLPALFEGQEDLISVTSTSDQVAKKIKNVSPPSSDNFFPFHFIYVY
jgi:hypothetical protein